jgi:hypothetical protein
LELHNVTAAEAVQALQAKALSLDPDYKSTTLLIAPDALRAAKKAVVTLSLPNQSLSQAAYSVAEQAGFETVLDENGLTLRRPALHFVQTKINYPAVAGLLRNDAQKYAEAHGVTFPPGAAISWNPSSGFLVMKNYRVNNDRLAAALGPAIEEAGRQAIISKAKGILIPTVDFTQATLADAISALEKESVARDPQHQGVVVLRAPEPNGLPKDVEHFDLHLKNTTLWDALQSVANATGMDLDPQDPAIAFNAKAPAKGGAIGSPGPRGGQEGPASGAQEIERILSSTPELAERTRWFQAPENFGKGDRSQAAPNGFRGRITEVNINWNFVAINAGEKQGAKVNSQLTIVRNGQNIAKARITSVQPMTSVADLIPGSLAPGQTVQLGDEIISAGGPGPAASAPAAGSP